MELDPRKPFAENLASGLQGLAWRPTLFLYLLAVVILVPVSTVTVQILGPRAPTYLIPVLVSLFVVVAYLYSWKLIFKRGPEHLLLYVGLLAATTYTVYWLPPGFIDQSWPHFDVLRRSTLWLVRGTAFRSLTGPLILFVAYAAIYYWFRIRGRRFIVVSDFRVWGDLEKKNPAKGVAGRLQDELMRFLAEMNASESGLPLERARPAAGSTAHADSPEPKPVLGGGFAMPETQVTLQYEGISLEALHKLIRRNTGREVVVTGDLFTDSNGVRLVARTENAGPWEVVIKNLDATSLGIGLQKLALRILTTLAQGFLPEEPNTFIFLQFKAKELEDFELVVRLSRLAWNAAPRRYKKEAKKNVARAYNTRGFWHAKRRRHVEASLDFEEATVWFPDYVRAWNNLGKAYLRLGEKEKARVAIEKAKDIIARESAWR